MEAAGGRGPGGKVWRAGEAIAAHFHITDLNKVISRESALALMRSIGFLTDKARQVGVANVRCSDPGSVPARC